MPSSSVNAPRIANEDNEGTVNDEVLDELPNDSSDNNNEEMNNDDVIITHTETCNVESSEQVIVQEQLQPEEDVVDHAANTTENSNAVSSKESSTIEILQELTTEESKENSDKMFISSDDGSLESSDIPSQQKDKESKYAGKLAKLYSKQGSVRESSVVLEICGRRATFCAFHYPMTNSYASDFDKCQKEFIEQDPQINMKLYRWEILGGLTLKMLEVSYAILLIYLELNNVFLCILE